MWGSIAFVIPMYLLFLVVGDTAHGVLPETIAIMSHTSFEMMNTMWWGILLGALALSLLAAVYPAHRASKISPVLALEGLDA